MKRLNILVLASTFYPKINGTTLAISEQINNLSKSGHRVFLVTRRLKGTPKVENWRSAAIIRVGATKGSVLSSLLLLINEIIISTILIRRFKIDLIHANGFLPLWAGLFSGKASSIPVVVTLHGLQRSWLTEARWISDSSLAVTLPAEKFALGKADAVVAQSDYFANFLRRLYGIDGKKVAIVPHPVDVKIFHSKRNIENRTHPIVLFVGTLGRIHGPDILLESAPKVINAIPETRFVFVGKGPLRDYLENKARDLGVDSSVEFVGEVVDRYKLSDWYSSATVVVVPVRYPGFFMSKVTIEAMATGRPVITTQKLDQNLVNHGIFFTECSRESIANKLEMILKMSSTEYNDVCNSASTYAQENCTSESVTSAIERVYAKVLIPFTAREKDKRTS
ncbi:MAG: glycosyltransferase family 4 protein [Nitrososphaerota archaeon]|nr:glycosyltransferase family 4 protein [Nitrososphaerota archaeon]